MRLIKFLEREREERLERLRERERKIERKKKRSLLGVLEVLALITEKVELNHDVVERHE